MARGNLSRWLWQHPPLNCHCEGGFAARGNLIRLFLHYLNNSLPSLPCQIHFNNPSNFLLGFPELWLRYKVSLPPIVIARLALASRGNLSRRQRKHKPSGKSSHFRNVIAKPASAGCGNLSRWQGSTQPFDDSCPLVQEIATASSPLHTTPRLAMTLWTVVVFLRVLSVLRLHYGQSE